MLSFTPQCEPAQETTIRPPAFVTVSVDDGHSSDLMTADLLSKFGLKATFYVPRRNPERPVMELSQLRELSTTFDVGGHTLSHMPLPRLREDAAWNEIRGCKDWLEDLLGRPAISFCYPQGKCNRQLRSLVAKARFVGARTCQFNLNCFPANPFQAGVSTHAFSHSVAAQVRHSLLQRNFRGLHSFVTINRMTTDWETHFRRVLDWVEINGGVAHLYLHSWEIQQKNEWDKLTRVFRDAARRKQIVPITNGELFSLATAKRKSLDDATLVNASFDGSRAFDCTLSKSRTGENGPATGLSLNSPD
jgi:peptidoglycan/xylan/chitin deacetylase (PgdA/CDA1 family)